MFFNKSDTTINGIYLSNSQWNLDYQSNWGFYIFQAKIPIKKGGSLNFGYDAEWNPYNARGKAQITAVVVGLTGEQNYSNNNDAEVIYYFIN